jgi:hypothetical protein
MRTTTALLAALSLLSLTACGLLSPETQQTAIAVLDQLRAQGAITPEQHAALLQALLAGSAPWWQTLAQILGSAALAYFGVMARRGPVQTRVAPQA